MLAVSLTFSDANISSRCRCGENYQYLQSITIFQASFIKRGAEHTSNYFHAEAVKGLKSCFFLSLLTFKAEQLAVIGPSQDLWRAYSLLLVRVGSFAPERSEGANDATRDTNKLSARQKSFDYHYYQYTRPNRTNS